MLLYIFGKIDEYCFDKTCTQSINSYKTFFTHEELDEITSITDTVLHIDKQEIYRLGLIILHKVYRLKQNILAVVSPMHT